MSLCEQLKMGIFLKYLLTESFYGNYFDSVSTQHFQLCSKKTVLALHNILTHSLQIHRQDAPLQLLAHAIF